MWSSRVNLALVLIAVPAANPAFAAKLSPDAINSAEPSNKSLSRDKATPAGVRLQVLLDRAHFSPGEIDGRFGENARKALRAYAEAQRLPSADRPTEEVWKALRADDRPVTSDYTISDKDVAGPFLEKLPSKMEDMKDIPKLGYTSPREAIAEKFHMSEQLLTALNPGKKFDQAGETVVVLDTGVGETGESVKADRVEVDKARQTVKLFDKSNALIGFYPATVGSEEKPSPSGTLKVTGAAIRPIATSRSTTSRACVPTSRSRSNRAPTTQWARYGSAYRRKDTGSMARPNRERSRRRNRTAACVLRTGMPSA